VWDPCGTPAYKISSASSLMSRELLTNLSYMAGEDDASDFEVDKCNNPRTELDSHAKN